MKDLPIGIQTFQDLIEGNFLYIDKTEYIYQMVRPAKGVYFLSRPRRFGKSLLLSTLEAIFKGKKELFQGLWMYDQPFEWKEHPVIRIDFSKTPSTTVLELQKNIIRQLDSNAEKYGVKLKEKEYYARFEELITKLAKINKVVVLIDEYDKPILDNITKTELAKEIQETLKYFYTVIKASDEYLKFIFLTGVSKFSKVGVFSGLNNLNDITMDENFSQLLGYTQEELETNFAEWITALAKKQHITFAEVLAMMKTWYNGYRFSEIDKYVYNPFSTLLLFNKNAFKNYWFESGTPTFLIDLITTSQFDVPSLQHLAVGQQAFASYEIGNLSPIALLYQTGYLTIQELEGRLYTLGFPNLEVEDSFLNYLSEAYSKVPKELTENYLDKLIRALNSADMVNFFETLKIFFANIPYTLNISLEKHYQTIFYIIFTLLGLRIQAEVVTNKGRIDIVIEVADSIYLLEFKLNGTKEQALEQIKRNEYSQKYQGTSKQVILVGVEFDKVTRNVGDWVVGIGEK